MGYPSGGPADSAVPPSPPFDVSRLLFLLALIVALPARAQGLFADASAPASFSVESLDAERARFVSVDAALLEAAPHQLRLNVFPDADAVATVRRVHRADGRLAWAGVTEDGGAVSLTLHKGYLVGRMLVSGRAYTVQPVPGGHAVLEARAEAEGADGIAVKAPASPVVMESLTGGAETFDMMVVWSTDAEAALGGAAQAEAYAAGAVDLFADVLANSGLPHTARLVYSGPAGYTSSGNASTDLSRFRNPSDGHMDGVHALRDTHGADFVALITNNGCGVAYVQDPIGSYFASSAFSQSAVSCGISNLTFPHEVGHNLGVRHDTYVDPSTSPFTYSHGWAAPSATPAERFRTVLAYNNACSDQGHNCPRQPFYSDPDASYQGRPAGHATTADATRHLDEVAATAAAFRPTAGPVDPLTVTVTPPADPVETVLGGEFYFDIEFAVGPTGPTSVQYWTEVILPNGNPYSPVIRATTVALTPGTTTTVSVRQRIPSKAPKGTYTYIVNVGTHPTADFTDTFGLIIRRRRSLAEPVEAPETWADLVGDAPEAGKDGFADDLGLGMPVPNPAASVVSVPFTASGPVRLDVTDVLGRRVATLVDGEVAGPQAARLSVRDLAPGVYVVRLEAEGRVLARRFTVAH